MARDPYVYPGTTVLKNTLHTRDSKELALYEAHIVMVKFRGLLMRGVPGELTPKWHRSVHHALFSEVYPWAGNFRTINISKEGEPPYADSLFLEDNAAKIYRDLKVANGLCDLERDIFIERLSHVMGELHVLHPFREGNTRTLQVVTAEIAYRAGHSLQWQHADPTTIRAAGTAAVFFDLKPYQKILTEICGAPQIR